MIRLDSSTYSHLQILEFHLQLSYCVFRDLAFRLASVISTITSPVFSVFVLLANSVNFQSLFRRIDEKSAWDLTDQVDQALLRLSQQTGMKTAVRRRVIHDAFFDALKGAFSLMVSAGTSKFEPSDLPPCTHWPTIS